MGDSVLERNLCFVDTPGYGSETSVGTNPLCATVLTPQSLETIIPVVDYIESHFKRAASMEGLNDAEVINMLSGNGGSQVDLVFYVFSQSKSPTRLPSGVDTFRGETRRH